VSTVGAEHGVEQQPHRLLFGSDAGVTAAGGFEGRQRGGSGAGGVRLAPVDRALRFHLLDQHDQAEADRDDHDVGEPFGHRAGPVEHDAVADEEQIQPDRRNDQRGDPAPPAGQVSAERDGEEKDDAGSADRQVLAEDGQDRRRQHHRHRAGDDLPRLEVLILRAAGQREGAQTRHPVRGFVAALDDRTGGAVRQF